MREVRAHAPHVYARRTVEGVAPSAPPRPRPLVRSPPSPPSDLPPPVAHAPAPRPARAQRDSTLIFDKRAIARNYMTT